MSVNLFFRVAYAHCRQDGKRHGEGTYTYSTMMGGVYTGQWRNGMRDGWGKLVKNDGEMYQVRCNDSVPRPEHF